MLENQLGYPDPLPRIDGYYLDLITSEKEADTIKEFLGVPPCVLQTPLVAEPIELGNAPENRGSPDHIALRLARGANMRTRIEEGRLAYRGIITADGIGMAEQDPELMAWIDRIQRSETTDFDLKIVPAGRSMALVALGGLTLAYGVGADKQRWAAAYGQTHVGGFASRDPARVAQAERSFDLLQAQAIDLNEYRGRG